MPASPTDGGASVATLPVAGAPSVALSLKLQLTEVDALVLVDGIERHLFDLYQLELAVGRAEVMRERLTFKRLLKALERLL